MEKKASTGRLRSIASAILGVLAAVLLPLSLVSIWLDANVTNTDKYVETVAPLAQDPVVQAGVENRITTALVEQLDVNAQVQKLSGALGDSTNADRLRRLAGVLTPLVQQFGESTIQDAVDRFVQSPEFATAWAEANRSAHEQMVGVLSGENSALVDSTGGISISLATIINTVTSTLATKGVPLTGKIPTVNATYTIMDADHLAKAQKLYNLVDGLSLWLSLGCLACALAAIALAHRRRRALGWVAGGFAAGVVVLAIGLRVAQHFLINNVGSDVDPQVARAVWDIVIVDLQREIRAALIVAIVMLVVAWVIGTSRSAVSVRTRTQQFGTAVASGNADRTAVLGAIGAIIAIVLVVLLV